MSQPLQRPEMPELGLVIPCFNEEAVLDRLVAELDAFAARIPCPVRVLFVNDGSRDRTADILNTVCETRPQFACIHFSRNFGHQTAVTAGLRFCRGDVIAVLDADLQDPPDVLLGMLAKWREGYDVVYGVRQQRKENALLRFCYASFYRLLRRMANVDLPLDAGDFSLMDRRVVDTINAMPEHNRFVRGLRGWVGFRQTGFPYERAARAAGETKYSLGRLFKLAFDGMLAFSSTPLRAISALGLACSLSSLAFIAYALLSKFLYAKTPQGWASLAAIVVFFGGVQLVVLGIMGEYLSRVFDEVKNRPHFIVDRSRGWIEDRTPPGQTRCSRENP